MSNPRRSTDPPGVSGVLTAYVVAVIACGLVALAAVLVTGNPIPMRGTGAYGLLAGIVIIGELFPITVTFRNERQSVTTSTSFVFAVLLMFGPAPTLLAQGVASIASDVRQRKVWWKGVFNLAQYSLCWTASAAVLAALIPGGRFHAASEVASTAGLAVIAAALVFFATNSFFITTAVALAQRLPVARHIAGNIGSYAWVSVVLLSLSPIVVVVAEQNAVFVPLLLAPLAAVYQSAQLSIEKQHQAAHDPLTDLPNRTYFSERVQQSIDEHPERPLTVMIVDLDNFKEVNDTLGHQVGDFLLQQIAERLRGAIPPGASVARLGGDEFAVLAAVTDGTETARAIADAVHAALETPFELEELTFEIGASIGAACFPEHGTDVGSLVRKADVAMYSAKESRGGFEPYHPERDRRDARRLTVLADLRQAIDEDQLILYYQPKAEMTTGRVIGVEALVRWQHPEHGLLRPDAFIPLAEPTGLMGPLTMSVLESALAQWRRWQDDGFDLRMAVNVSVRNLYDEHFVVDVDRLLERFDVPASHLTLEITESTMMADPTRPVAALSRLSMRGVQIAIDDFGTGYSSLAHLKRLPVTEIKIDKSFVLGMLDSPDDATIVRSTIDLARNLGLTVVAEGVERRETWEALALLRCDRAQGYLLSRPAPADDFLRWLVRYEGADRRDHEPAFARPAELHAV